MNLRDPQGLALAPSVDPKIDVMEWLASPDGGAIRWGQAMHISRAIALGEVPHVRMVEPAPIGREATTDGGRTWTKIELAGPNDWAVTHGEWMEVDGKRIPLAEYFGSYQHTLGKSK